MADLPALSQIWPPALRASEAQFQLLGGWRSGGQGVDGSEQRIASPGARWTCKMTVPIQDRRSGTRPDQVLAYRWLMNRLAIAGTVLVPACDGRGPGARAGLGRRAVPLSDGAFLSDGTGFVQNATGATLAANAALNGTQIVVSLGAGLVLLPGMRFSMPDGRLHEVQEMDALSGTSWTVRIVPWLRADYAAGIPLEFDRPVCQMWLAQPDTGGLSLQLNRSASPTIELVEPL